MTQRTELAISKRIRSGPHATISRDMTNIKRGVKSMSRDMTLAEEAVAGASPGGGGSELPFALETVVTFGQYVTPNDIRGVIIDTVDHSAWTGGSIILPNNPSNLQRFLYIAGCDMVGTTFSQAPEQGDISPRWTPSALSTGDSVEFIWMAEADHYDPIPPGEWTAMLRVRQSVPGSLFAISITADGTAASATESDFSAGFGMVLNLEINSAGAWQPTIVDDVDLLALFRAGFPAEDGLDAYVGEATIVRLSDKVMSVYFTTPSGAPYSIEEDTTYTLEFDQSLFVNADGNVTVPDAISVTNEA